MSTLLAVRWRKYGKDRLYVNDPITEQRIGWVDLLTGKQTLECADRGTEFEQAIADYLSSNRIATPQTQGTSQTVALHAERWRRFGQDRLYVSATSGQRIGWVDLSTGLATLNDAADLESFWIAVTAYCTERSIPIPDLRLEQPSEGRSTSDRDLASNRPGEAAHEKALNEYARWQRGAEGEQAVGASLDSLHGEGWRTLHSIRLDDGRTDIDHLTIGPAGLFSVNAKNHLGHFVQVTRSGVQVDRKSTRYLHASRQEAQRAGYLLSQALGYLVTVNPLIVVLCDDLKVKSQPDGVWVLQRGEVDGWLSALPAHYTSEVVENIYSAARRESTWHPYS